MLPNTLASRETTMGKLPQLERIDVIRDLYPKCFYCGGSIRQTPLRELVKVHDRDRLAHRDCLAAEADDAAD